MSKCSLKNSSGGIGPWAVSCCDSRADPAIVFDADPGDMFVCRNVASLVPPYTPDEGHHGTCAAIEYAVTALKVGPGGYCSPRHMMPCN